MVLCQPIVAQNETPANAAKPLEYLLVITGGELLEGVYPDAHTPFIIRTLRPLGCQCVGVIMVDDNREDIVRACRWATNRAPLVIVTGGLGPTPNDITRETLAQFTGIALREEPELVAAIARRLRQSESQLAPNLRRQTLIPSPGTYLPNTNGTAAGLVFAMPSNVVVALPGPPRELQPMVTTALVPYLRQRFGVREFGSTLVLRFVGVGQSVIDQTIKDHVAVAPDVVVTSLFDGSRVDFFFSLPGHQPADRARLNSLADSIREHLRDSMYAQDNTTLEEVVIRRLGLLGHKVAIAEVGTGGCLTAALGSSPSTSTFVAGSFTAPDAAAIAKLLGLSLVVKNGPVEKAPSLEVIAQKTAQLTDSQLAIVVIPEVASGEGKLPFRVGLLYPDGHCVVETLAGRESAEIQGRNLATAILRQLWRQLRTP